MSCYSCNVAAKKIRKPDYTGSLADYKQSLKPASSKKEKLFSQELGKIGRAAERGGPVNEVQKQHGEYSEQVMYANKMKNMPFKKKLQDLGIQLTVSAATNPNTLRAITGGVAKATNVLSGKQVVVHGSPTQSLSVIEPRTGSNAAPTEKVAYGWNPSAKNSASFVAQNAQTSATGAGSIYVAKAPKLSTKYEEGFDKAITKTSSPMKVVKEITVQGKTQGQIREELASTLKRAGAPLKTGKTAPVLKKPPTKRF